MYVDTAIQNDPLHGSGYCEHNMDDAGFTVSSLIGLGGHLQ